MYPHNKFNLFCKFVGLAPISKNSQTQRVLSVYSLITIVATITVITICFSTNVFGDGFVVSSMATSAVYIAAVTSHTTTLLESLLKRKEQETFFSNLYELDVIFKIKLRHKIKVRANRKKLIIKYSILSFVVLLCLFIYISIITQIDYEGYFWHSCLAVIVARIRFIQTCVYVDLVILRFNDMNKLLKQIANCRLHGTNRMLDVDYGSVDNPERIYVLKSVYTKLSALVYCLNETFGWSILTLTVYFCLDLTCNCYWLFVSWEAYVPEYHIYESYVTIFPIALLLSFLSYTCSECVNKSEVTKQLVQKMLASSTVDYTNYLLDALLLQIYNQPIVIHAKRFFNINIKLLTSIVASIMGYLVILIQFLYSENEV